MLKVFTAFEIKANGIFKDHFSAKLFNKGIGEKLHLHRIRTTLSMNEFLATFYSRGGEGAYLELCCGKGNVEINITKPPFLALQGIVGSSSEEHIIIENFEAYEASGYWEKKFIKRQGYYLGKKLRTMQQTPSKS